MSLRASVATLVWQSPGFFRPPTKTYVIARRPAADVALSKDSLRSQSVSPLAPTLGELAAKPTERAKITLSASGTSPIGRGKLPSSVSCLRETHETAVNCGMTATGSHLYFKFAARSATLGQQGEPLRLAEGSRKIRGIATPVCALARDLSRINFPCSL